MKKLLACLVLLSTLCTPDVFCSKQQNAKKEKEEKARIQRIIDQNIITVTQEVSDFKARYLIAISGKTELVKGLKNIHKLTTEGFVELVFNEAFTDNTKKAIATCLYHLNPERNTIKKLTLLEKIKQTITPILIPYLSKQSKKEPTWCDYLFTDEIDSSIKINIQQQKTMKRSDAIDIILSSITTSMGRLTLMTAVNHKPENDCLDLRLTKPLPQLDSEEEEGEEEGEQEEEGEEESSEEEALCEEITPDSNFIEECEKERTRVDQEFDQELKTGRLLLEEKLQQELAQQKKEIKSFLEELEFEKIETAFKNLSLNKKQN